MKKPNNYFKEFEKLGLKEKDLPKYTNAQEFASGFKKCTMYEYGHARYSNYSPRIKTNANLNMPSWIQVLDEIEKHAEQNNSLDLVRRKYTKRCQRL